MPPPEPVLTALLIAFTHELVRLLKSKDRLDQGAANPTALPADEKVTIFLSHTKADGAEIAGDIRQYIRHHYQLNTFFDANDIPYGEDFDPVLRREVSKGALLVVQTDAYASSVWCLEELLEAKKHRRPVLVVNAVAAGEERGPVYAGNVPTRRHDKGHYDRIVCRMILEVLRVEHFTRHFQKVAGMFNIPADVKPLPYAPEPLVLADLQLADEKTTRFVYPDPPLSEGELSRLTVLNKAVTVTTPLFLLATGGRSVIPDDKTTTDSPGPTPKLQDRVVGISVGNSPDLGALGMGDQHLNEAAVTFARYLLASGADLAYGGTPTLARRPDGTQPPNFLLILLDLVRAHNRMAGAGHKARLRSYIAEPNEAGTNAKFRATWRPVIDIQIVKGGVTKEHPEYFSRSLTAMRQAMTANTHARVLLGGATAGFQGRYPGIAEEAYLATEAKQPVYLIASFGGAARRVIDGLEGRPSHVLPAAATAGEPVTDEYFRTKGLPGLNNGLTDDENRRLFVTPHTIEMVCLVLLGLGRVWRTAVG
jgi:hypothetical protein